MNGLETRYIVHLLDLIYTSMHAVWPQSILECTSYLSLYHEPSQNFECYSGFEDTQLYQSSLKACVYWDTNKRSVEE